MGRRERKKEEMRMRLLDVAMALFEREGFENVTMERIAEEADVAKATLYSYFPVKEALLVEWIQLLTADLGKRMEKRLRQHKNTRARTQTLFALIRELVESRRSLVERYILFRLSSRERFYGEQDLRSGISGILQQLLTQGQTNGQIRRDITTGELTSHLESLFLSTLMVWFVSGDEAGLEKRLEVMLTLFFEGAGGDNEN